jgi:ABC-type polysaccharide/polyol phosphate export permease
MKITKNAQSRLVAQDLWLGLKSVEIWWTLAWQDIRQRYRRSMIGPFWLTLSTGLTVVGLGLVFAAIFRMPRTDYLVFLAIGMVTWVLISGLVIDGCKTFISAESIIKQIRLPLSVHAHRVLWRNLIVFGHNALIIVAVFAFAGTWPSPEKILLVLPALIAIALNGLWIALFLGLLCARFRDIGPVILSLLQFAFLVTPIMWHPSLLPGRNRVVRWNPFHHFVELVRAPLLGDSPSADTWTFVFVVTLAGWTITLLLFRQFRRRIPYWL